MADRLQYLFEKYINKTSSASEVAELMGLALEDGNQDELKALIDAVWTTTEAEEDVPAGLAEELIENLFPKSKVKRMNWRRIAVAASILLVVGLGSYLMVNKVPHSVRDDKPLVKNKENEIVAPEANRATITLADGRLVYLDSAANGNLAMQEGVSVVKLADGKIVYEVASATPRNEVFVYNTLSNPRGSKVIDMTLTDGSHVWLNAGSSVTYPVSFVGNERKVSITGEAYFEVNKQLAVGSGQLQPFIVEKGGMRVTVLGTHFNVNAYDDEADIKVTLLEGSVKVATSLTPRNDVVIKPGQQATISNGQLAIRNNIDVDAVMAWKNGYFQLSGSSIQEIMRQVSRWYDVEIVYEGKVPERQFGGQMAKSANLLGLLKILKESNVNCRIEGKKLVVGFVK